MSLSSTPTSTESLALSSPPAHPAPLLFPFLDLRAQFATIRDEVVGAVMKVMESQEFILGKEVRLFEEEVGAFLGTRHAISCASGSDALALSMMALGIGPDDEVITTPFTFGATAGSILRVGAKPVFVDIDARTYNVDPAHLEAAITSRTRAIMPVHLFGLPAPLDPILACAGSHGLPVIEDAAQAMGARYRNRTVGTFGSLGCFSFFPSKNLGCAGDGGLVTTDVSTLADRLGLLRAHGSRKKYRYEIPGTNSRLDALQAAILRVKLRHLNRWTQARQSNAEKYGQLFETLGLNELITLPYPTNPSVSHVYNQFSIRCRERDALRDHLRHRGIPTEVYYPSPLHLEPAFASLGYRRGDFPVAEAASEQILSLPIYPEMTAGRQDLIVNAIAEFYSNRT